jgi:hypothetical protein
MNAHKKVEKFCVVCGGRFMARAADNRPGRGRTCSHGCSGRLRWKSIGAHPVMGAAHPPKPDLPG